MRRLRVGLIVRMKEALEYCALFGLGRCGCETRRDVVVRAVGEDCCDIEMPKDIISHVDVLELDAADLMSEAEQCLGPDQVIQSSCLRMKRDKRRQCRGY